MSIGMLGAIYGAINGVLNGRKPAVVQDESVANPRYLVTPEISGTPTPSIILDGESPAGTDYIPRYVLCTINPGDDVTGATRLMNGYPDVLMVQPGETLEITAGSAITDLYLIGIVIGAGGAAVDIDTFTDYAALIGRGDTDTADWLAQQKHLTFDSSDDVRKVRVTLTEAIDTNVKLVRIEGVSYAQ